MPRDPEIVAEELRQVGCELPPGNLEGLAFSLMPDETVLGGLLGPGEEGGRHRGLQSSPLDRATTRYDQVLLLSTRWRVMCRCYSHTRRDSWDVKHDWNVLWQHVEEFSGAEVDGKRWVFVYNGLLRASEFVSGSFNPGSNGCIYPEAAVDRDRFTAFVNIGQRKLQAVKFTSALVAVPDADSVTSQLERLASMKRDGDLSEREFEEAKRRLLWG